MPNYLMTLLLFNLEGSFLDIRFSSVFKNMYSTKVKVNEPKVDSKPSKQVEMYYR